MNNEYYKLWHLSVGEREEKRWDEKIREDV